MKQKITTVFLTLATTLAFAQDGSFDVKAPLPSLETKAKKSFGYVKMGVSDSQLPTDGVDQVLPGLGLGYRIAAGSSAIDLSISGNRRDIQTADGKEKTYTYTLPKANYLYFLSPAKNNSFYAGAGVAAGGVRTEDGREFHGLIPNVAVGYEMNRNGALRSFAQLDVSQPALAAIQTGILPNTFAEFSLGAGF